MSLRSFSLLVMLLTVGFCSGCQIMGKWIPLLDPPTTMFIPPNTTKSSIQNLDDFTETSVLKNLLKEDHWISNKNWSPLIENKHVVLISDGEDLVPNRHWIFSEEQFTARFDIKHLSMMNKVDSISITQKNRGQISAKKNVNKNRSQQKDQIAADKNQKTEQPERISAKTWKQPLYIMLKEIDDHPPTTYFSGVDRGSVFGFPMFYADDYLAHFQKKNNMQSWNAAIVSVLRNNRLERSEKEMIRTEKILSRIVTQPLQYHIATGNAINQKKRIKKDKKKNKEDQLKSAIISLNMRAAAADAWCLLLAESTTEPIDGLSPVGRLLESAELPNEVHAQLFRSVARWIPPVDIPRLNRAFQDVRNPAQRTPKEIRIAAIDACLIHAITLQHTTTWDDHLYPVDVMYCQNDPDAIVRKKFGQWLSVSNHPRAFSILKSQLYDQNMNVRDAALLSLGRLQTTEAKAELHQQMKQTNADKLQMTTVRGLSFWGSEEIAQYVNHSSAHIRQAVATSLGQHPVVDSAMIVQKLILDAAPQVQKSGVQATETWRNDLAIPLLLTGFRDSSLVMTRELCLTELQKRQQFNKPISADASTKERLLFVQHLINEHHVPTGFLNKIRQAAHQTTNKIDIARQQELQLWVNQLVQNRPSSPLYIEAYQHLTQLEPKDLSLVEQSLLKVDEAQTKVFFHNLLPRISKIYQSLMLLESSDILKRRKAARELSQLSEKKTLSLLAVKRLHSLMTKNYDQMVWRFVMQAISKDATNENAQIALLAIQNSWWDIRVLGCDYIAQHGQPTHALWLLPLFEDANNNVRLAAIKAAGQCNHQVVLDGLRASKKGDRDLTGLRSLLTDANSEIHFQTVVSMCRLSDEQAMQELMRMSYQDNLKQKKRVIQAMGKTGQSRFVNHLIQLGWIESSDATKRTILKSLERLVPKEKQPVSSSHATSDDEQINNWVKWAELKDAR